PLHHHSFPTRRSSDLYTMRKGRIQFTVPMLWALAFIPTFLIGGVTGVMLGMAAADFHYHNTMFLIAHFHYTLVGGVVYAVFAALDRKSTRLNSSHVNN